MPRVLRYLLTLGITLVALLVVAITRGTKTQLASTASYVYVLSPDARFTTIDLAAQRVIASGQFAELHSIDRVYPNPFGDNLFIQSPTVSDQSSTQATEQLAVISAVRGAKEPNFQVTRWIRGPTASSRPIWAKALNKNLLFVSWENEQGRISTVLYDATTQAVQRVVENFSVTPTTCLSSDGQTVYAVANNPTREIKALNLKTLAIASSSYDSVGSPSAYYKAPVAADGCTVAFIERIQTPTQRSSPAMIYIHNLESNTTLKKFNIDGIGRFAMVLNRNLLLLNLEALVPNTVGGTTIGVRRASTGSLLLYDTTTGNESAQISVPKEGELAGVASDGNSAYYISPSLLTVIDLVNRRVSARIDLPFSHGMLALGPRDYGWRQKPTA